ncbi:hypothetical protein OG473_39415 (plasmid) [Streptomyces anulatus]|uniref:hypothetical protein n=1 Tax=Streptomyces anulatus TaxID=1892 RepID=UPI0032561812
MIRKHLPSIVYIALLVAAALPFGFLVGATHMPPVLTVTLIVVASLVIAVGVDPLARLILRWFDDRALVREHTRRGPR